MTTFWDELPDVRTRADPVPRKRRQLVQPVFNRPAGWRPHEDLPELAGTVFLDLETKDRGLASGRGTHWYRHDGGFICGAAVGTDADDFYLSMRHAEGNIDRERVERWLTAQAAKPDVEFVFANAPYDLGWLRSLGISPVTLPHDVQAQAAMLDEFKYDYSLDGLGKEYLGQGKNDIVFKARCQQAGLVDPMSNMDMVPGWLAEFYALQDIALTRGLYAHFKPMIDAAKLDEVYQLERECLLLAVDMKGVGVKIDLDRVELLNRDFTRKRDHFIDLIYERTKVRVEPNDADAITRAIRVEVPEFEGGSIKQEVIDALPSTPTTIAIQWMRKYDKAIGTTLGGMLRNEYRGRLHSDFRPLRITDERGSGGTVSGRWSSSHINLQNIPVREPEIGIPIRACFVPEDGCDWVKLDYASQEPRLTIHYAALMKLRGAQAMIDRFNRFPMTDLHLETALLMFRHTMETWEMLDRAKRKELRSRAKIINLAIAYGAGGGNIAQQLGLPTERKTFINSEGQEISYIGAGPEGQALLDAHMRAVPYMKELQKIAKERGEMQGYVRTILGRILRFKGGPGHWYRTHSALNKVIQGSAADQLKKACVLLRREGILVPLIVHDEGDLSVPRGADAFIARVKQVMEQAVPLNLPVIAEPKIGADWGAVSVD